ncbi:GPW/gp25 family protein [Paramagnetospirillum magneticum]|uniref:Phage baseplate assembly protein W n=1 Tax=Paramagnetospirillum magneticum (strain ATCC 700264 / AMB-1) TaxID=342108 RepID=Q2W627_PARM1|nr:GPW/gp25 family protein [Paramagnetospirillum magneticum]BAE50698.1 Phage baseplate assembly protein W [Paramagnetospirillum magneticum AMB-1]
MAAPPSTTVSGGDFLGRGWAFPVIPVAGTLPFAADDVDIRQAILIILQTAPGERVMRPQFGCRINELLFAAGNAATSSLAQLYVRQALEQWEPRIQVVTVTATIPPSDRQCLNISVDYLIRDRNRPDNLVYPFFLK